MVYREWVLKSVQFNYWVLEKAWKFSIFFMLLMVLSLVKPHWNHLASLPKSLFWKEAFPHLSQETCTRIFTITTWKQSRKEDEWTASPQKGNYSAAQGCCSPLLMGEGSQFTQQNLQKLRPQPCQIPLELVRWGDDHMEDRDRTLILCFSLPKLELGIRMKRESWD